jgi:hypothetical protein
MHKQEARRYVIFVDPFFMEDRCNVLEIKCISELAYSRIST